MAKLFKRVGTSHVKFQFGLEVHALQMSVRVGPERKMSIMWTRGPRVCTTPPVENCRKKEQPARYEWGKKHPLLLLCTLYKEKGGKFQSKSKIIVRQHKEGEKGEKMLGTCYLDLAENLSEDVAEFSKDLVLSLEKCADVDAELHVTIHSKPIVAIKLENKMEEEKNLSHIGSFSEGAIEAVDSLDEPDKNGLDDSLREPHSPVSRVNAVSSANKEVGINRGVSQSVVNEKKRKPIVPGDTSGFSSVDSIIVSQRNLIQELLEKLEELGGKKPKDTTEEGTKDKEEIIRRQDKFISALQREVTDLSKSKGVQETKEAKVKDRRASIEKKRKRKSTSNARNQRVTRTTAVGAKCE